MWLDSNIIFRDVFFLQINCHKLCSDLSQKGTSKDRPTKALGVSSDKSKTLEVQNIIDQSSGQIILAAELSSKILGRRDAANSVD